MPQPSPPLEAVLAALYASEINCDLESFWDGGFRMWIGDQKNGHVVDHHISADQADTIGLWSLESAARLFPRSRFATGRSLAPPDDPS
jgi:hypothetical protein